FAFEVRQGFGRIAPFAHTERTTRHRVHQEKDDGGNDEQNEEQRDKALDDVTDHQYSLTMFSQQKPRKTVHLVDAPFSLTKQPGVQATSACDMCRSFRLHW